MRVAFFVLTATVFLAIPPMLRGEGARLTAVDPLSAKAGEMVGATGESISKANVAELYLTDGGVDFKVVMLEQTDTLIKFKIPNAVKPGRYNLMIKTTGSAPKLLEQPVRVEVVTVSAQN
jgi:hypothetical protein